MTPANDGKYNLTRTIVEDLGQQIVAQCYPIGGALPFEAQLCTQYDASRPILREAVKMLTAKGLLVARQRLGTIVQPESNWSLLDPDVLRWMLGRAFSIDLLIEFTEMRLAIEPRAAALAAHSANGAQRRAISVAIDRMFAADGGQDDPLEADIAFHVAVLEASNNRFFQQFTGLSEAALRFSIRRTNEFKGVTRADAGEHKAIKDAILLGDPGLASERMSQLLYAALDLAQNARITA